MNSRKRVSMDDMYPLIIKSLNNGGTATFLVSGTSMQPMIFNRRDSVTIASPKFPLKKNDIPLFRMNDGKFVLHRVVHINKDGTYNCRGDNRWKSEKNIRQEQVVGVVTSFERDGRHVDIETSKFYKFYCKAWYFLRFFKYPAKIIRRAFIKIKKRIK